MTFRLLLFVLLLPVFASAQFLPANTTLQQAFIQATQEDKLIFLMIESAECQQCNDVADKSLRDENLQRQLKDHFVALRISPLPPRPELYKRKIQLYQLEEKAISLLIKQKTSTETFDTVLQKMKKNELNIN